jgi:hypothetical protein
VVVHSKHDNSQSTTLARVELRVENHNSLGAINFNIDDDEMVQIYLKGLARKYGLFRTAITMWENSPPFVDLQSMLLSKENHVQTWTDASDGKMRPRLWLWRNGRRSG